MDKTKRVVGDIMSKAGHHDTTVDETVAPAVEHRTVKPTQHEEINTAIDQEVHQDHYHRTVQPVQASETMPEQHTHRVAGAAHREFDHRDQAGTERAVRAEAGKLRDQRTVEETRHTQSHAPTVQGEHVHHHVHETVQPLVHKEVIQPEVIHTTQPIHEVHHNAARVHETSTKEPISMEQFKKQGGGLTGAEGRTNAFDGCPKGKGIHEESMPHTSTTSTHSSTEHTHDLRSSETHEKKPSLMDRLNPYKDADKDGKKGFMS